MLCAWLLSADAAVARPPQPWADLSTTVFQNYGREQGLIHPVPTALAQDRQGFLWIGTQGGLSRWDGYRFISYHHDPAVAGSLPDDWIDVLHVDPAGRLWIGTGVGRLVRYDTARDTFVVVPIAGKRTPGHIDAIEDDGRGGLWIGTDIGLVRLDPGTGHSAIQRTGIGGLPPGEVQAVLRDRSDGLWIGTEGGLAYRAPGASSLVPITVGTGPVAVTALCEEPNGRIWIGTSQSGLFVIDRPGAATRQVIGGILTHNRVAAIAAAGPHEMWAALRNAGIVAIDTATGATTPIRHDRFVPNSLANNDIWALLRDDAGSIWAGGTGGLSYHPPEDGRIATVFGAQEGARSLSNPDVSAILAARDGHVWFGYINGGVDVVDPIRGRIATLPIDDDRPESALPNDIVYAAAEGEKGIVYVATRRGLYAADPGGHHVALVILPGRDPHLSVTAVAYIGGTLWIGGLGDGVWGARPSPGGGWTVVWGPKQSAALTAGRILFVAPGAGHDLWIGTRRGLNRIDLASHAIERIAAGPTGAGTLHGSFVTSLAIDHQGRTWIGTFGGGVALMIGHGSDGGPRFRSFGLADRLPHMNVDSLQIDRAGILWAGTDDGLARIDTGTFAIDPIGAAEGAPLRAYFIGSSAIDADGDLLFGAKGGMTVVRPGIRPHWDFRPRVVITELRVGGAPVPAFSFNQPDNRKPITLLPGGNAISIEFAALDFTAPDRNRYAYRLEGYEGGGWIDVDPGHRQVTYTNLPPGDYQLRLRGSNHEGRWSDRDLVVSIQVRPAWHQRLSVWIGAFVVALFAIIAFLRLWTTLLRSRHAELERLVAERTAALSTANERLLALSRVDSLTGCATREHFIERVREMIALANRHGTPLCLAIADLDHFKRINDSWGHPVGDTVLRDAGRLFGLQPRATDMCGRIGGEEFALVMPHTDLAGGALLAERLRQQVAETGIEAGDNILRITVSFGVAALRPGEEFDALYARADAALYAAKNNGRDRVEIAE
jgi:diguanylate cyclase (GGDEF)-like protein